MDCTYEIKAPDGDGWRLCEWGTRVADDFNPAPTSLAATAEALRVERIPMRILSDGPDLPAVYRMLVWSGMTGNQLATPPDYTQDIDPTG